jgi:hypothetical protein
MGAGLSDGQRQDSYIRHVTPCSLESTRILKELFPSYSGSFTFKRGRRSFSETSASTYQTTRHRVTEHCSCHCVIIIIIIIIIIITFTPTNKTYR